MTNKFRDALESTPKFNFSKKSIDYISMEAGRWAFRNAQTIEKALTIAAELQDDAETIKALDEAGDYAARGKWWVDNGITVQGENGNYGIRPDRGDNVYFVVSAANARPVIKKLAKLVKEGE